MVWIEVSWLFGAGTKRKEYKPMTNEEFQALVLQQLRSLNEGQKSLTEGQKSLAEGQARTEKRMDKLEKSQDILAREVMAVKSKTDEVNTNLTKLALRIENEVEPKISVLFEGHKQLTEQLTRIEEQVSKHDEYILKRIK